MMNLQELESRGLYIQKHKINISIRVRVLRLVELKAKNIPSLVNHWHGTKSKTLSSD